MDERKTNGRVVVLGVVVAVAAVVGVFAVHAWSRHCRAVEAREKAAARSVFLARFGIASDGVEEFVELPAMVPHDRGPAKLGEDLFCDARLAQSVRRSCAACHHLNEGGVDNRLHGEVITRTVMNAVFSPVFLHDGSCTNLADVIARMIESRAYAGGGSLQKVVSRLGADERMLERFRVCYEAGLTTTNLLDALVQNCSTLLSPRTAFDRYWGGRKDALDARQKEGMGLFRRRGCLSCHDGPALGGLRVSEGKKVPTLRGIGFRRLFLANGSRNDLGAVLTLMPGGPFEETERAALVSFLKSL